MKPTSSFVPIAYGFVGAGFFFLVSHSGPALAQVATAIPFVHLQPTTPGTQQSGHSNISGTAIAGQFVGGGSGLTGVNADTLDGINSTAFLQAVPNPLALAGNPVSGSIITATNSGNATASSGVKGAATTATGVVYGVWGTVSSASGRGVFGDATSTTGVTYGGRFESDSNAGRGVYGLTGNTSGTTYGVLGQSNGDTGRGVYGLAANTTGANYGGYFDSNSTSGIGVFGTAPLYGGRFTSVSSIGAAVYAGNPSATSTGILARAAGTSGSSAVRAVNAELSGGDQFNSTIRAIAEGRSPHALVINANGDAGSTTFIADSAVTVMDLDTTASGAGIAVDVSSGSSPALYAAAAGAGANVAVRALGNTTATGTKSFEIDHPLDPENKILRHYCSEGPAPYLVYRGNVTLGSDGSAWVNLPAYFDAINTDVTYQLTCVGGFAPVYVSQKVKGNRFQVAGGKPGMEVSWSVTGVRNDKYVQHYGIQTEIDKTGVERGRYLAPEAYGVSKARSVAEGRKIVSDDTSRRSVTPQRP